VLKETAQSLIDGTITNGKNASCKVKDVFSTLWESI